jgi:tetratricopeptide (TPR) repeat protein
MLLLIPALAAADVLHMADGTIRQGRIIDANPKEVVVDFGAGSVSLVTRIPRSEIVRIEEKASPQEELMEGYLRRRQQAKRGDADDWYALGVWCQRQRVLKQRAREAFERAIALDPDHRPAHAALGHVSLNGRWMTPEQALEALAPGFGDVSEFKARSLEARKAAQVAEAKLLEAQAQAKKLEAEVEKLEKENRELRRQVATPPPPPRDRIIYRPIIIRRPRPHHRKHHDGGDEKHGGKHEKDAD